MGVGVGPKQVEVADIQENIVDSGDGSLPYLVEVVVADVGSNKDHDIVLTRKSRVIDAWCIKTGGDGTSTNAITIKETANAISDAMDISIVDTTLVRCATLDDAQNEIPEGGTLRITLTTGTGDDSCKVYILLVPIS